MKKYIIILFIFFFVLSSMPSVTVGRYNYVGNNIVSILLPFAHPVTNNEVMIPSNIDARGKTDVSFELINFINSTPDGSIINFPSFAVYRIDRAIEFSNRHNLIFNGNGCTIKYTRITGTDEPFSIFLDSKKGSNIWIKNFVLVGSSPFSGIFKPGEAPDGGENQCGVITRSDYTEISNCVVNNVWGDGFYVVDNPSNIWIHDNHVISAGRNGTSIISGKNIIVEKNTYDKVGFMAFDVEPNWPGESSDNIAFCNNTIGTWGYYFSGIVGNAVSASINNIKIENNVVINKYLSAYINSRNGTRITNIIFSNNKGYVSGKGPLIVLEQVDGYSIENNIQSLSSGDLISIKDSKKECITSDRPFSYITSYNLVPVPSNIDSTGKTDTSALLNDFIKNVPDGSTINFPSNGIYRIDKAIFFENRHNLIIDGNNCTLKYTSITGTKQSYSFFYDEGGGSDIWIKNFNFIGSSPYPGVFTPGEAPYGGEYQHGVVIASERFEVSSCHVSGVWGDGFIIFRGSAYIHDNHVISAGRQGLSIISCSSVLAENNVFDKVGGSAFDVEPIRVSDSCTNVSFINNIIGSFGTPKLFTPYVFNVVNNASTIIDNVIIDSNIVRKGSISTYIDSCKESRIKNITFTNNTGTVPRIGPVIYIKHVDGVNIWKNVQSLISGNLIWVPDCTKVITSIPNYTSSSKIYGVGISGDTLWNVQIGGTASGAKNTIVSNRFKASITGNLVSFREYWIGKGYEGYSGGTGGIIRVTVEADDGKGFPSGIVLATKTVKDPLDNFPLYYFDSPAPLIKGKIYHLVHTNIDSNPLVNFCGLNNIGVFGEASVPSNALFPNNEYAQETKYDSKPWIEREYLTPIMELIYSNGFSQGMGYIEFPQISNYSLIKGSKFMVKESFTLQSEDFVVSSAYVRIRRTFGNGDLLLHLESSDGKNVETVKIPAFSVPASAPGKDEGGAVWVSAKFLSSPKLVYGKSYSLRLTTDNNTEYTLTTIRKGFDYGFSDSTYFKDGAAYKTVDGIDWINAVYSPHQTPPETDIMFYFVIK